MSSSHGAIKTGAQELVVWMVLDKTGSMHNFGTACKDSFPELLPLIAILGAGKASIRLVAYGDYDEPEIVVEMSGPNEAAEELLETVEIRGGGDFPEACKTALYRILREIKTEDSSAEEQFPEACKTSDAFKKGSSKQHVLFLFTDACPHFSLEGPLGSARAHFEAEEAELGRNFDWLHLSRCMASRGVSTVTFIPEHARDACAPFYALLGPVLLLPNPTPAAITAAMSSVFLTMMHEVPCHPPAGGSARVARGPFSVAKRHEAEWRRQVADIERSVLLPRAPLEELTPEQATQALQAGAPQVAEVLAATLPKLPDMLKRNAELRAVAVRHLLKLAVPGRVRTLMLNPALGKVWRAVAAFRRVDPDISLLCDAFGSAVQGDAEMRAWVESTYNMQEEIDEALHSCSSTERYILSSTPLATAPAFPIPTLRETLDLLRGGISAEVAGGVLEALRGVTVATLPPHPASSSWGPEHGIPVDIPDAQLFSVLLHLMHAGTMASTRAAAMVAVFALVAAPAGPLAERARAWLGGERMKGRWTGAHDWDTYPEVFSVQFMLLMRREQVQTLLTPQETTFFRRMWYVWRVQRTLTCMLRVRTAEQLGKKPVTRPDHRYACRKCKHTRPLSLMNKGVCVFCTEHIQNVPVPECSEQKESHMVQCRGKNCRAFYAVERPDLLLCDPKCFFCRQGVPAPTLECRVCRAKHIAPDAPTMARSAKLQWMCAPCMAADTRDSSTIQEVPIQALVRENEALLDALECSVPKPALDKRLAAAFRDHDSEIVFRVPTDDSLMTWKGARVLNWVAVCSQLRETVLSADISDLCELCCMSVALASLGPACGDGGCGVKMCGGCRKRWYEVPPGTLPLAESRLSCPFCRRAPHPRAAFCGRRNLPRDIVLEAGMVHGYCRVCRVVKPAAPRECVGGEVPAVEDWMCGDCRAQEEAAAEVAEVAAACAQAEEEERERAAVRVRGGEGCVPVRRVEQEGVHPRVMRLVRLCPGCGYGTEKAGGCNHMTCVVCAAHWCWRCGGEFSRDTIYDHLHEVCGLGL